MLLVDGPNEHRDPKSAYAWFIKAATAGHKHAAYMVGMLLYDGTVGADRITGKPSFIEARQWFHRCAGELDQHQQQPASDDDRNTVALCHFQLGVMAEYGLEQDQDWPLARRYYKLSADGVRAAC